MPGRSTRSFGCSNMLRTLVGLVAAALWLPTALYLLFPNDGGKIAAIIAAMCTVPLTLVIAAPVVFLLRRKLSLGWCIGLGVATGVAGLVECIFVFPLSLDFLLFWCIGAGVVSSLVFWIVGVVGNRYFNPASRHAAT